MDSLVKKYRWLPFVAPFLVFVGITGITPYIPHGVMWMYPAKTCIVTLFVIIFWKYYPNLGKFHFWLAIAVGLLTLGIWIHPQHYYPWLGEPQIFNPWVQLSIPYCYIWIAIRLLGSSILVPIIEEIFWRGFILRWLISSNFEQVPVGTFHRATFFWCALLFGVEHHLWLVGIVAGILYGWLLCHTKSLATCILAHGITNFALGIYVLHTQNWIFW